MRENAAVDLTSWSREGNEYSNFNPNAAAAASAAANDQNVRRGANVGDVLVAALDTASDIFGKKNPDDVEPIAVVDSSYGPSGLSTGAVVGIVAGVLVLGTVIFLVVKKK